MFTEPIFAMIVTDFTNRICLLRNERQIASKLNPLNYLLAGISVVRLLGQLPELFTTKIDETSILISVEGSTYYQSHGETGSAYYLIDLTCLLISITLMTFLQQWLKTHLLFFLWVVKLSIYLAITIFSVTSITLLDTITIINIILLYMKVNIQTLLYDVEDSREKLDRFFSYNFLFFDDD